ncbi:MAG: hypothetical protein KKC19_03620 [Nanoarchaeota archaeon]|nr:hypothetical protein [Nanoarchaeota archaeon]
MSKKDIIEFIVGTYDLSPKLEEKIVRISRNRISELGISRFDAIYGYVGNLIEKFQIPYGERVALRLDELITSDSKNNFHEIIGVEDSELEEKESDYGFSLDEVLSVLDGNIDKNDLDLIKQLVPQEENFRELLLDKERVIENVSFIHSKLEELVHVYEKNGKIVIPKKPLIEVKFSPLRIKFGRRNYNEETPLDFFKENIKTYKGMTRVELQKFDGGLYSSLWRWGQLDEAIPEKFSQGCKLSAMQIEQIIVSVLKNNKDVIQTARETGFSVPTIRKYAKFSGFDIPDNRKNSPGRKKHLSEQQINEIISSYDIYNGNASEVSRNLPYSINSVLKYWKKEGLESFYSFKNKNRKRPNTFEVISAYSTYEGNAAEAARNFSYSQDTFLRHWKKLKLIP